MFFQDGQQKQLSDTKFCKLPLLCIGTPLVELHEEVPDSMLEHFGLQQNAAVQVEERHWPLLKELTSGGNGKWMVEYLLGGGAAVSASVASHLARGDGKSAGDFVYIGAVGRDEMGAKFAELCRNEGIQPLLSATDSELTGWRAVLRTKNQKPFVEGLGPPPGEDFEFVRRGGVSVATFTGAGHEYPLDHLRFKVWESVESAKIIYIEASFLVVSPESARIVAEHCAKVGKTFVLNLSARYICGFFRDKILTLLPYIDFLIGNESEYMELAENNKEMEKCETIDDVISVLAKVPRADADPRKKRFILVTNGPLPVVVGHCWKGYGVKIQRYPVPLVPAWRFTTKDGAGDAFTGGLLYACMAKADLDQCVHMALYAAQIAVQRTSPEFLFDDDRPHVDCSGGGDLPTTT